MDQIVINTAPNLLALSSYEIIINISASVIIGFWIAFCYQKTHHGLSYSQGFVHSLILITIIICTVIMVIGSSLASAFALVGAMSIIRFRTILKDTKDLIYVFAALTLGMGAGTGNYKLCIIASLFFGVISFILHRINYASIYRSDFILNFKVKIDKENSIKNPMYLNLFDKYCSSYHLLNIEPLLNKNFNKISYDITLNANVDPNKFVEDFKGLKDVSEIIFVSSKNDVDF